jgi:hypothetical protein
MNIFSWRTVLALAVAVALSLILWVYVSKSPYIFALGLALGAYIAQISTFKAGLLFGAIAALPFALYAGWRGLMPADSDEFSVLLNTFLLIAFGGVYCGLIASLISSLKRGKVFFS